MKPSVLEAKGITVHRVVQNPGDFIVTFPGKLLHKLLLLITLTAWQPLYGNAPTFLSLADSRFRLQLNHWTSCEVMYISQSNLHFSPLHEEDPWPSYAYLSVRSKFRRNNSNSCF